MFMRSAGLVRGGCKVHADVATVNCGHVDDGICFPRLDVAKSAVVE